MSSPSLSSLISRVEEGRGPDVELESLVWRVLVAKEGDVWVQFEDRWLRRDPKDLVAYDSAPAILTSFDAAVALFREVLPGWWWRGGTCWVSSEARICPDHGSPEHALRLHREFPPEIDVWNEGLEVELRPGSDETLARALIAAVLRVRAIVSCKGCEQTDVQQEQP
ncbi:conserved hypothetical protein [Hyphomicrobiales bacterium]|nr:conserved hypothetical protein [Hyphomicrobiales bacterium]CAH1702969.1 conserved hypothetical protein [Hyphomicrobiales bacterium]CAI0347155.1 conserved hypothetical protein [Hyphomicrobiales bacterium]